MSPASGSRKSPFDHQPAPLIQGKHALKLRTIAKRLAGRQDGMLPAQAGELYGHGGVSLTGHAPHALD